jgi:hypothetical protein
MANLFLENIDLSQEGTYFSEEISNAVSLDMQGIVSDGAIGTTLNSIERKTTNGRWRQVKDDRDRKITFKTFNENEDGVSLREVNSFALRVKTQVLSGGSGTYNIDYDII